MDIKRLLCGVMMFHSVTYGVYKSKGNEVVNHYLWIGSSITECKEVVHACNCDAQFGKDLLRASAYCNML